MADIADRPPRAFAISACIRSRHHLVSLCVFLFAASRRQAFHPLARACLARRHDKLRHRKHHAPAGVCEIDAIGPRDLLLRPRTARG